MQKVLSPLKSLICSPGSAAISELVRPTRQNLRRSIVVLDSETTGFNPRLDRIVIAGGDSSGEVAIALDIDALTVIAGLSPGAPLCRAWSTNADRDGLEIVLKGGQMGRDDFFGLARGGVRRLAG